MKAIISLEGLEGLEAFTVFCMYSTDLALEPVIPTVSIT
jgi:hypothetical protein